MKLTVVGCSGSVPGPQSAASCYLVEADGFRLVLDLGNGAWGQLLRYTSPDRIGAVAISHTHADHCLDLCPMYVHLRYGLPAMVPPVPVLGPASTGHRIASAYDVPLAELETVLAFRAFVDEPVAVGPFTVTSRLLKHPVPSFGSRIEYDGKVLVFSGDTGPCEELDQLAADADLYLVEAAFVEGAANPPDLHLTGREAGLSATAAGAGRVLLTHVPPWIAAGVAEREAAEVFDGEILIAEPGLVVDV
jgi:ribonuclease BN (tRNA processing enzyme)